MNKFNLLIRFTIFTFFTLIMACGTGDGDENNQNTKHLGTWLYVQNGGELAIDGSTDTAPIELVDDNLIKINSDSGEHKYLLKAFEGKKEFLSGKTTVTGSVVDVQFEPEPVNPDEVVITDDIDIDTILENEGLTNIEVVLIDINSLFAPYSTTTGANGQFSFSGIDQGTYILRGISTSDSETLFEYTVEISGTSYNTGISTTVERSDEKKYNFKSFIDTNDLYVFGDYWTYNGKFEIQNIGSENAIGLNYAFDCSNEFIQDCSFNNVLGSIVAGRSVTIPFEISFKFLDETKKEIKIPVQITDAFGNQWTDFGIIDVYRVPMAIKHVIGRSTNRPMLISPENIIDRPYFYGAATTTKVPYFPGEEYRLLFANSKYSTETAYSFGVETDIGNLVEFSETQRFEPNETFSDAKIVSQGETITSYAHAGDLDYYRIPMPTENAPTTPYSFKVIGHGDFYDFNRYDDSVRGNGNRVLNRGEKAAFRVGIKNFGNSIANNVTVSVSSDSPYVSVTNPIPRTITWIKGGEMIDSAGRKLTSTSIPASSYNDSHTVEVNDSEDVIGKTITFTVSIEDGYGNIWTDTFEETIQ